MFWVSGIGEANDLHDSCLPCGRSAPRHGSSRRGGRIQGWLFCRSGECRVCDCEIWQTPSILNRERRALSPCREFERGKTSKPALTESRPNSHKLQLSSGSCQTTLSRIWRPSRSIHCSAFQQAKTSMTTKRHPPTVVMATSRIDGRGDVTLAPQDGQTSFRLDP